MELNPSQREITFKLVYYGPGLSGKTTNLQAIHDRIDPQFRGRLMRLDTADDRTLFFDMLPVTVQTSSGIKVKVKLFTVPGQVMHNSTRRIVLQKADGVAFIADSQRSQSKANNEYWADMRQKLRENGIDPQHIPIVIQFNKTDLPDTRSAEEIDDIKRKGKEPVFSAVAVRGDGVLETFFGLLDYTFRNVDQEHDLQGKFGINRAEFLNQVKACFKPVEMSA